MSKLGDFIAESDKLGVDIGHLYPVMSEIYGMSVAINSFKNALKQCESCTGCDDEET